MTLRSRPPARRSVAVPVSDASFSGRATVVLLDPAEPGPWDGGPWRGPGLSEWLARVSRWPTPWVEGGSRVVW